MGDVPGRTVMFAGAARGARTAVVCLLVVLVLAVPAQALRVEPEMPLRFSPEVPVEGVLHVYVSCFDILASPSERVVLKVEPGHPGIHVEGLEEKTVSAQDCEEAMGGPVAVPFQMHAGRDVPALEGIQVIFDAFLGNARSRATEEIMLDYSGGFELQAPSTARMVAPQKETRYLLEVRNLANAATVFTFEAVPPTEGYVVAPPSIQLARNGVEGDVKAVDVRYVGPFENGPNDVSETFTIRVHAGSSKDPELGAETQEVSFQAHTKGLYVPGPGLALLAAGFLGAAALRRPFKSQGSVGDA